MITDMVGIKRFFKGTMWELQDKRKLNRIEKFLSVWSSTALSVYVANLVLPMNDVWRLIYGG